MRQRDSLGSTRSLGSTDWLCARSLGACLASTAFLALASHAATPRAPVPGDDGADPYLFRQTLPAQSAPNAGEALTFTFDDLPQAAGDWRAQVRVRASADIGLLDERLYIEFGNGEWQQINFENETDCALPASCVVEQAWIPALAQRAVTIRVLASSGVNGKACPDGFVEVTLQFMAEPEHDCNNNRIDDSEEFASGALDDCNDNLWADTCELARFPDRDCDGNGLPDCCDQANGSSDCDGNGRLDVCDIAADPTRDCDGDGRLDLCEIAIDGASDIDRNNIPDSCDIAAGRLEDCDRNGIADLADLSIAGNDANGDWNLDGCSTGSPDLFLDGWVTSADLAILLSLWGGTDPRGDLDFDGSIGASDVSILLAGWGPLGVCGDGKLDPAENCCNCPQDAGCGSGFDCYYGACVPCVGGSCPPGKDECEALYGFAPPLTYGNELCYGPPREPLDCFYAFTDTSRGHGFAMSVLSPVTSHSSVAMASLGLLGLLAFPRRACAQLKRRILRPATDTRRTNL